MTTYFITATGTGIGKTFTTCALLYAARGAVGYKPVISGWSDDDNTDTAQIIAAGGGKQTVEEVSPWRFTAPLSPHRAAALEGRAVDVEELVRWTQVKVELCALVGDADSPIPRISDFCSSQKSEILGESSKRKNLDSPRIAARFGEWGNPQNLSDSKQLTLIETVGGVMVPLTNEYTTLDWMAAAKLPVVLVTGSYLGTISHTLTAMEVLRARGIFIKALVMNESESSVVAFEEAKAGLVPFIRDIELQIFQPRVSSWREARAIHALAEKL